MSRARDPHEETPWDNDTSTFLLDPPPREELEGMNIYEIKQEYEVAGDTAARWQSYHGIYEPEKDEGGSSIHAGASGGLAGTLKDLSADEFSRKYVPARHRRGGEPDE
jgi:hypothetical protein